jgi:hypothetical protein
MGSTVGRRQLILPSAVRDVVIAVDRDAAGVGERCAHAAATRWRSEGRRVRLIIPDRIGANACDLLGNMCRAAA